MNKIKNHFKNNKGKYIVGGTCLLVGIGLGLIIKNRNNKINIPIGKEKETIWRIQEEDFRMVAHDSFPHLTNEQVESIIEKAHRNFSIDQWTDYVEGFIVSEDAWYV